MTARLDRIARDDAAIGAFWQIDPAAAQQSGIPIGVKDNIDVAGLRTTAGIAAFADRIATADAPCIASLRRHGFVVLGKLSMHEGALGATNDTPRICMNPLRDGYTPGGSSGGSAAAVAAGFVDLAVGTDTMGSVRIPAAYCGVVGFKPTTGLVARSGVVPLSPALDHVGMLAATPRLAARGLQALACDHPADSASRPTPRGWRAAPDAPPTVHGLRIGLPEPILAAPMEPAIRAAWDEAAGRLRDAGAIVASVSVPGWDPTATRRAGLLLIEAEAAALHPALIDDPAAASPAFRAALAYGRSATAPRLAAALFRLAEARAGALRALDGCDALLLPTAPQRAFPHGTPAPADQADFCAIANIAGLPALALPWPANDGGLPCSIQLIGHPYAEALLTGLADTLA